ncbi:hypothetical protein ANCCAN_12368 [Ancylostoma caninum]|uniref:Uncharacterized protein n=1 Tax=Ancylostoma caninum TaxID=29170 RepID=A0A368GDE1_ANCCA|nr:hypothetical protein ANCCAN_12368 [Ancylostoma caninum]
MAPSTWRQPMKLAGITLKHFSFSVNTVAVDLRKTEYRYTSAAVLPKILPSQSTRERRRVARCRRDETDKTMHRSDGSTNTEERIHSFCIFIS